MKFVVFLVLAFAPQDDAEAALALAKAAAAPKVQPKTLCDCTSPADCICGPDCKCENCKTGPRLSDARAQARKEGKLLIIFAGKRPGDVSALQGCVVCYIAPGLHEWDNRIVWERPDGGLEAWRHGTALEGIAAYLRQRNAPQATYQQPTYQPSFAPSFQPRMMMGGGRGAANC